MRKTLLLALFGWGLSGCAEGLEGFGGGGGGESSDGSGAGGPGATSGGPGATSGPSTGAGPSTSSSGSSTVTSSGSTSSASASSSASTGSGMDPDPTTLLMMAGGGSSVIGSRFNVVTQESFSYPWLTMTTEPMGFVVTDSGLAVGALRAYGDGALQYVTYGSNWSLFSPVQAGLSVGAPPRLTVQGNQVHAVYEDMTGGYAYALYDTNQWTVIGEAVGSPASEGPTRAAVATVGSDPVVLFVGDDGDLHARRRASGTWQAESALGLAIDVAPLAPVMVTPASGADLLAVFVEEATGQLYFTEQGGGLWSTPAAISGAQALDPPELAVLDGGDVLLTWRGTDSRPYVSTYAGGTWSAPGEVAAPGITVACTPAISRGASGADAELVYTDTNLLLTYWSRLTTSGWTPAQWIGTASPPSCVSIAVVP